MAVLPLPLDPGSQARTILHHLLENGDIIGRDEAGRTVIQLSADDSLEQLMTFDAGSEDLEDNGDGEPDDMLSPASHPARATGSTSRYGNHTAKWNFPGFLPGCEPPNLRDRLRNAQVPGRQALSDTRP